MDTIHNRQKAQQQAKLIEADLQKDIPLLSWRVECDFELWPLVYFNIIGAVEINGQKFNSLKQVSEEKYYTICEQGYWKEYIHTEIAHSLANFIITWKQQTT